MTRRPTPPLELVMRSVDTSGGQDACWPWLGWRSKQGYGQAKVVEDGRQRSRPAHRAVYLLTHGIDLPPDVFLLHQCDNPPCCNPRHLVPGDQVQNMRERKERGAGYLTGSDHPLAVNVSDEIVAAIRAEYRWHVKGRGAAALAAKYGLRTTTVLGIANRRGRWADGCEADRKASESA